MKNLCIGAFALLLLAATGCDEEEDSVEGIDLRITDTRIPFSTELVEGAAIPVEVAIKNYGTEIAPLGFDVKLEFYEDAARTIPSPWPTVTWPNVAQDLGPGEGLAVSSVTVVDVSSAPRLVFCRSFVDFNNEVAEANEDNNCDFKVVQVLGEGSVTPVTTGSSDLIVTSVLAPALILQDDTGTVSVTIQNPGNAPITTPFTVTFEVYDDISHSGTPLRAADEWDVGSIASGQELSHEFFFIPTAAEVGGGAYFLVTADWYNEVSEASESNNEGSGSSLIEPQPNPDLVVSAISCTEHLDLSSTSAQLTVNYTVTNQGSVVANATVIRLEIRDQAQGGSVIETLGTFLVLSLDPGESFSGSKNLDPDETLLDLNDYYFVFGIADGSGVVQESAEGNNARSCIFLTYAQ